MTGHIPFCSAHRRSTDAHDNLYVPWSWQLRQIDNFYIGNAQKLDRGMTINCRDSAASISIALSVVDLEG
jgi:hypothetical protein